MPGSISVQRLGSFGAEISGVDLSRPLDRAMAQAIIDAAVERHVAVFRGQDLDRRAFDQFGRVWGEPIEFFYGPDCEPGFPTLMRVSNAASIEPARREGAGFWHTDLSYEYLPAIFTMLLGVEAPIHGGETLFADMAAAYEALPSTTKASIDGLRVKHKLVGGKRDEGEAGLKIDPDDPAIDGGAWARKRALENPLHPLVLVHPISGRKALYAVAGSGFSVEGLAPRDGEALLAELKRHVLQPQFRIAIKAGPGDVLVWDDLSTLHSATPLEYSDEEGKRRLLLRYTTRSLPPVYADRPPPFVAPADAVSVKF